MKIAVVCDAHIFRTSNNEFWCKTVYSYEFFQRFMQVFDSVRVVARVKDLELPEDGKYLRVDGPNLEVHPVYFFQGPKQFIPSIGKIILSLKGFENECDVILYRMPSTTAQVAYLMTRKANQPKGIEVVYNLHDELLDNKLSTHRKLIGYVNHVWVKKACRDINVNGVSYVTKNLLQKYYPSYSRIHGEDITHFENYYSTIQYKANYIGVPKTYVGKRHWLITHVVIHIQNNLRGHECMIKALKQVRNQGHDMEIEFIGDGPMIPEFQSLAESLGVSDYVHFIGLLPSPADVNEHLIKADLFVYPTHFGGLPRVLIEAMGAGLPCISTPIAGIPEMLNTEDLIPVDDDIALAKRLIQLVNDPEYLESQSRRNIAIAKEYTDDKLQNRRNEFYRKLTQCSKA